jgi:hypothetical protein
VKVIANWKEIGTTPKGRKILRKNDQYRIQSGRHYRDYSANQLNRIYKILKRPKYLSTSDIAVATNLTYRDVQEGLYILMAKGEIKRKRGEEKRPGGREYVYFLPHIKPEGRPWTFAIKLKSGRIVNVHNLNMHGERGVVYLFNQDWFEEVDVRQIESIEIKRSKPTARIKTGEKVICNKT